MVAYPSPPTPRAPRIPRSAQHVTTAPDTPSTPPDGLATTEQFARTYQQTFDAVFRYAGLLSTNPQEAEDLVAETYLRAWTNRRTYRRTGPILAWLLSITHNLAITRIRRATTAIAAQTRQQQLPDAHTSPSAEQCAAQTRDTTTLFRAIRRLPTAQQQVVALRFLGGCSNATIAQTLGKREDAVRALQYRALKQLRKSLDNDSAIG
jgi:RNA polymerase sigma-70 factor (ECF subfamily)